MSTEWQILVPKIGNHPKACPCVTCTAAVAKLKAMPYVKLLESELIAAIKAGAEGSPAVVTSLEAQVLSLRELLAKRDDDNRTLTNVLAESRKISQEREAQLTKVQQALKSTEDKLNISTVQLRNANEEKESLAESLKAAQAVKDLTADDLDSALAQVEDLAQRCNLYKGQAERTSEANLKLITENKQMATERDGYAADVKRALEEASTQRKAADDATIRVGQLLAENTDLRTQLTQAADTLKQEEDASRGGMLITLTVTAFVTCLVSFLIGRYGR